MLILATPKQKKTLQYIDNRIEQLSKLQTKLAKALIDAEILQYRFRIPQEEFNLMTHLDRVRLSAVSKALCKYRIYDDFICALLQKEYGEEKI